MGGVYRIWSPKKHLLFGAGVVGGAEYGFDCDQVCLLNVLKIRMTIHQERTQWGSSAKPTPSHIRSGFAHPDGGRIGSR